MGLKEWAVKRMINNPGAFNSVMVDAINRLEIKKMEREQKKAEKKEEDSDGRRKNNEEMS